MDGFKDIQELLSQPIIRNIADAALQFLQGIAQHSQNDNPGLGLSQQTPRISPAQTGGENPGINPIQMLGSSQPGISTAQTGGENRGINRINMVGSSQPGISTAQTGGQNRGINPIQMLGSSHPGISTAQTGGQNRGINHIQMLGSSQPGISQPVIRDPIQQQISFQPIYRFQQDGQDSHLTCTVDSLGGVASLQDIWTSHALVQQGSVPTLPVMHQQLVEEIPSSGAINSTPQQSLIEFSLPICSSINPTATDICERFGHNVYAICNDQISDHRGQFPTLSIDFSNSFTAELKQQYSDEFSIEMLCDLLDKGYNVPKISKLLNIERWRIKYHMKKAGLKSRQFSNISNQELDCIVSEIVRMFPNSGFKNFIGQYNSRGPKVSRERLRESFCRVKEFRMDPPRRTIKRRVYNVKGPLSLWHVDSHHKLSRWKFYVQGCVDGFSRLMVVLNLASNNRAETTLRQFLIAVAKWGLPLRVRSDHGTENYGVCDFMLVARSEVSNPFIAGTSVHNQRVERSWRDVFETALEPFHAMFYAWEGNGHLNPSNMIDLVSLHISCKPLLIKTIECFAHGWNNHPLSTEHNETPTRLFHGKLIEFWNAEGDDCDLLRQDVAKMEEALCQLPSYPHDDYDIEDFLTKDEIQSLNVNGSLVTLENAFQVYMYVRTAVENIIRLR
ncbi:uncharacterized protein LOC124197236 isoform X2 [Daphnia pulex]|uniref:uncharacterized protein LOC124197236 isoform X2 n=1 Tax=Daphnia pulex TaxID=6669 RepID=UPI001EDEC4A2|nr:uncharacterized protein LOC124197236 isoform X2 [Daphnia pulex]